MSATCTFDVFSNLDGFGSPSPGEDLAPIARVPAHVIQQANVGGEFIAEALGGGEVAPFDHQAGIADPRQALEE